MKPGNALMRTAMRTCVAIAAAVLLVVAASAGIACDDDSAGGNAPTAAAPTVDAAGREVQQALESVADAWNAEDTEAFLAGWTDAGLVSGFGEPGSDLEEIKAGLDEFIGSQKLGNFEFIETRVEGDSATLDVQYTLDVALDRSVFTFVRRDGVWLIDNEEPDVALKVPAGATSIDVAMADFAFTADTGAIAAAEGSIAFLSENTGAQDHEIGIVRIADGIDLLATLQSFEPREGEDPAGLTFLGGDYVPVGTESTIAFSAPLAAGRYAFVCMLPDTNEGEDGTPHALKGMVKEFTVE